MTEGCTRKDNAYLSELKKLVLNVNFVASNIFTKSKRAPY
jgi:hypothetical protein